MNFDNIVTAELTEEQKREVELNKNKSVITSSLEPLKKMNGLRPSEFSVLIGPKGNGKSAFCKTMIHEAAMSGINTYVLLSEEKPSIYKNTNYNIFKNSNNPEKYYNSVFYDSMLSWEKSLFDINQFFVRLETAINEFTIDLIVFDNFTTSFLGSSGPSVQHEAIMRLRELAAAYEICILGVFHTIKGTNIYNKVLDGEDVRGSSTSTNAGSYNFVLSTYFRVSPPRAILLVDKARYHKEVNQTYWELFYNPLTEIYDGAKEVDYQDIRDVQIEAQNKRKNTKELLRDQQTW